MSVSTCNVQCFLFFFSHFRRFVFPSIFDLLIALSEFGLKNAHTCRVQRLLYVLLRLRYFRIFNSRWSASALRQSSLHFVRSLELTVWVVVTTDEHGRNTRSFGFRMRCISINGHEIRRRNHIRMLFMRMKKTAAYRMKYERKLRNYRIDERMSNAVWYTARRKCNL